MYNITKVKNRHETFIYGEIDMKKDQTNKNFWDRFSKIYHPFMKRNAVAYENICQYLAKYIDNQKSVLELACGTGQITFCMADKAKLWEATDYSENMVNEAMRRGKEVAGGNKISFQVQDATKLTYESESFDVVVIANALHIMPNPDLALREIHRVLKKDGILFAPTFVYENGYSRLTIWLMERLGFKTYYKWKKKEFVQYVSNYGFQVVEDSLLNGKPVPECMLVARR